jgi:enoyl-CoA hydratase/carnithine racemase
MQFDVIEGVARVRPAHVPRPRDWIAALDPVLDNPAAHVLLVDLTAATAAAPGWDDAACRRWRLWRKPTIAVLDGAIEADLLAFALACDIRVAATRTSLVFSRGHCTRLLESLVGRPRAVTLRSGGALDAAAAQQEGLVFALSESPEPEGARIARTIASRGPLAVQLAKEAIWRGLEMPLEQALRFETDLTLLLQTTKDRAEGVSAFLEKREPHFIGS